ncbi:MAG TPA: gamma-glutamyltransferase [Gammaproteobacteria bacterium]
MKSVRLPCRHLAAAFAAFLLVLAPAWAAETLPQRAGIASAHPLADAAGYEILEKGGNAFDAAVAVSAALGVVEPYSSGLGGGGFYLLHRAEDGFETMIDARETAPAASTSDMYLDASGNVERSRVREGALSAGIPGTPAALVHLSGKYGRLTLAEALAPAIRLARDGFRLDPRFAAMIEDNVDKLKRHCAPGCPFLIDDAAPFPEGEVLRQPELAKTLTALADHGGESFYRGEIAQQLVAGVRARGGIWTLQDMKNYRVVERAPVHGEYRGFEIITASPPSSGGITLLETLNILSGYDLEAAPDDLRVHLIAEAWRRAYRDRNEYLGDPDFVTMPAERLMHPLYAAGLRAGISEDKATPSRLLPSVAPHREGSHTSHFSILDREGNRVAATQTVNFRFGGGLVPAVTGVVLNNEMDDFTAKPGEPNGFGLVQGAANVVVPGKRPLSSMAPTFVESEGSVAILGTPGGSRIISMVTLGVLDYVHGGDAESMVSLPRFHHQYLPDAIGHEPGAFDGELMDALRARGHALQETNRQYGNMNVVIWNRETGEVDIAHDPRNAKARVDF